MRPDRQWMYERLKDGYRSETFVQKVEEFIDFACRQDDFLVNQKLRCPCAKCRNAKFQKLEVVKLHLYKNGFRPLYHQWMHHGSFQIQSNPIKLSTPLISSSIRHLMDSEASTKAIQMRHPESCEMPNLPSLPLHSGLLSSHHQSLHPGYLQQPSQSGIFHHYPLQPPLPMQDRPPIPLHFQNAAGILHMQQPIFHEKISNNLKVALMEANNRVSSHENFISSPLGIDMLLSMVAAGSTGETRNQLLKFLSSKNLETVNMKASKIVEIISPTTNQKKSERTSPVVSFVNGAWVDLHFSIRNSFSRLLESTYRAEAKAVDFVEKEEVCKEVNLWASKSTQGLINEILKPELLKEDSMLILANALFFKAAWEHQFTFTKNREFYLMNGETVEAPLMTHDEFGKLKGASFDSFKLVKIPYRRVRDGREFSMYIFLPNEKKGLPSLLQKFSKDSSFLDQEFELKRNVLSEFWIPKFKMSHKFSAVDTLKKLGVDRMFMMVGELTEIVDDPSSKLLRLSEFLQKSHIEVNEEGTEAASVSVAFLSCGCAPEDLIPRKKLSFVADHPFMFLIREDTSGATLFVGAVLNPVMD